MHLSMVPVASRHTLARRIFDHGQAIERFDRYMQAINLSAHTRLKYCFVARKFGDFLGEKSFAGVDKTDVRGYIATLYGRNLAPGTLQTALYALRSLYKFLRLGSQVLTSAPQYIQTRKLPKRLPHAKSEAEIERLIAAAGSVRNTALVELGYASGLRASELSDLRCEEIDLRGRSLTVRNGKGGKDRIALFGRKAAAALEAHLAGRASGPVFGVTSRQIGRIVAEIGKRAGVPDVHPHILRHSMATHCLNHGMDIRFVQELLGHSSLVATQKYLHVATVRLQDVHKRFHPRGTK